MGCRRAPSLESFSSLIADIHDAGVDEAGWPAALRRLGSLFNAPRAMIWMQDKAGGTRAMHMLERDDRITRDYFEHYGRGDLLRRAITGAPAGTVLTNDMVVPRSEFVRTEFYADFAAPHGLIDCIQARVFDIASSNLSGCLGVAISSSLKSGVFEREHVRLLALLLPHLGRAMQMQLRLARLGVERDCALEALDRLRHGVLVVDAQAWVLHANSAAEAILRKGDGLDVEPVGRQLRASAPGQTNVLRRFVTQAAMGPPFRTGTLACSGSTAPGKRRSCFASSRCAPRRLGTCPCSRRRSCCSASRSTRRRRRFWRPCARFTASPRREAAVAGRIGQAEAVEAAAAAMRITPATLRWHLQRVLEKTGTARQAELVRLVEHLDLVGVRPGSRPRLTQASA